MSVEAITWVLNDAPGVPSKLVSTLIGLANHAAPDGRNAYPSQATLAAYTRKSERQIRRDLADLQDLGLIRRGDQRIVEHFAQDRRPVVYNLAIGRTNDLDGGTSTAGRPCPGGHQRPAVDVRGDTNDRSSMAERGDMGDRTGGTPTSAKPSVEPTGTIKKNNPPNPPRGEQRGTRLPEDFPVTSEMAAWAREKAPTCGMSDHEEFCDYWRGVPGAKGRKLDWEATWRNWMRRAHERRTARRSNSNGAVVPINGRTQLTGTDATVAGWLALADEAEAQEARR